MIIFVLTVKQLRPIGIGHFCSICWSFFQPFLFVCLCVCLFICLFGITFVVRVHLIEMSISDPKICKGEEKHQLLADRPSSKPVHFFKSAKKNVVN